MAEDVVMRRTPYRRFRGPACLAGLLLALAAIQYAPAADPVNPRHAPAIGQKPPNIRPIQLAQQNFVPLPPIGPRHVEGFSTDRSMQKRLTKARELLTDGNYSEGLRLLQSILERSEDSFFYPDPANHSLHRSVKVEAQHLLGELPRAARENYEQLYGPAARQMLNAALEQGDLESLAVIMRQFFYTQAGQDATSRLAAELMDRGRWMAAVLCWERLQQNPWRSQQVEPLQSVKLALCWLRLGETQRAQQTLVELRKQHPQVRLEIAGKSVPLFDKPEQAVAWLRQTTGSGQDSRGTAIRDQWLAFRGDAQRNAMQTLGSAPGPLLWQASTLEQALGSPHREQALEEVFDYWLTELRSEDGDDQAVSMIPMFHPLVAGNLVITRGFADTRAYDLQSGKLVWTSVDKDQLLAKLADLPMQPLHLEVASPISLFLMQRAWRSLTTGTLTSDGQLVFVIEDIGFPGIGVPQAPPNQVSEYTRLVAYEVATGKAIWEAGSPRSDARSEFAGTVFLGPPLVLDEHLYCMAEVAGELRLLVIKSRTGKLAWSQLLKESEPVMEGPLRLQDQSHWSYGLSPSQSSGILVCPTDSGAVVAVDLTSRGLLWAYQYEVPEAVSPRNQMMRRFLAPNRSGRSRDLTGNNTQEWLDSLATISAGHVLVTPHELDEIHCLNLLDGSLNWKQPRGDGLYVAGIQDDMAIIVGRTAVRALRMSDGKPAWREPTVIPLPSGRGCRDGQRYYLPLSTGEVAVIDLHDGRLLSRTAIRNGQIPGNLVAARQTILSQTGNTLTAFAPLDTREGEIAAALEIDPFDAAALTDRGELRLQRGELLPACDDFRLALTSDSTQSRARTLLTATLFEALRVDFTNQRALVPELQRLVTDIPQRTRLMLSLALGYQQAGDVRSAFDAYLELVDFDGQPVPTESLDGNWHIRRDRLVKARLGQLRESASSELRADMDLAIAERFAPLRDRRNPVEIARFLDYFGNQPASAGAQRLYVELLALQERWLESERWLRNLQASSDSQQAAEATARLAVMLLDANRPADALKVIEELAAGWGSVVALDGKTGAQLAEEWKHRNDVARLLVRRPEWPRGKVESQRQPVVNAVGVRNYTISFLSPQQPFFVEKTLQADQRGQELILQDALGREQWKLPIGQHSLPWGMPLANRAYARDHLLMLVVGPRFLAVDPLGTSTAPGPRLLWQKDLLVPQPGMPFANINARVVVLPNGVIQQMAVDQAGHPIGNLGLVTHDCVCLQQGRKLLAVDALSGEELWSRDDLPTGCRLFGDEQYLVVHPPGAPAAEVYRVADGELLGSREIPESQQLLTTLGRRLITWNLVESELVLSARDLWTEESLWTHAFGKDARITLVDQDEATVLEPDGKLVTIDLVDGRILMSSQLPPHQDLQQVLVMRGEQDDIVIANEPRVPQPDSVRVQPIPTHAAVLNGTIAAIERSTGRVRWAVPVSQQGIDIKQPAGLPVLVLAAQIITPPAPGKPYRPKYAVTCLDKQTGKVVYEHEGNEAFFNVEAMADPEHHRLQLQLFKSTLTLTFTDDTKPESEPE